jgi:hypothetical protein
LDGFDSLFEVSTAVTQYRWAVASPGLESVHDVLASTVTS